MTPSGGQSGQERPTDLFISYSPADERWASWIAWQLEAAGHRTMMQAWDFVPGTNFIDFMDRGLSEAKVVVAVLSSNYLRSRYGRMEWMAALRADPDDPARKLVTVRIEDCPIDGLLSTITYVDLVGIADPDAARTLLMRRVGEALAGHARPLDGPGFPGGGPLPPGGPAPAAPPAPQEPTGERPARRAPVAAPAFPAGGGGQDEPRERLSVLHIAGPRFGRTLAEPGEPTTATELQDRIWSDVTRLADSGVPRPELLVVTGNLTHSGSRREFAEALSFLTSLRALLGLEAQRVVIVPGTRDVTRAACQAYFSSCEADDIDPQPPYWPKWRHYAGLFKELYQGLDALIFDSAQPWTLFPIPDLKVAVAGLNSTLPQTHREEDRYGQVGQAQAAWFTERLRHFEDEGWLRLAAVEHTPVAGEPGALRDPDTVDTLLGGHVNLFFQGTGSELGAVPLLPSGAPSVPALGPGRHQIVVVRRDGMDRWIPEDAARRGPERLERDWTRVLGTFPPPREHAPSEAPAGPAPRLGGSGPGGGPADPADPPPDPTARLLDRLTEACETRFERANIRRIVPAPLEDGRADPPHLLLTHMEDGFVRQYRIGAHVGRVTEPDVDAFVRHVHADGTDSGSELVYLGPAPPRGVRDDALRRGIRVRSLTEFQGLLDLSEYVTAQTGRLSSGGLYPPSLYVEQRFRELDRADRNVQDDAVGEMLRLLAADHGRFLLLLGDFGRGKTFALRELARRIPAELPHIIPILIELRALDKAHSVDGLVAAHLANHGEELIDLKAFHYMLRQGRIVLLFDGFDELVTRVTYDQAADHLDTLLRAAQDKAKIVVASRTQHFKSQAQVLTALGERVGVLPHRRVLGLEEFTLAQVRAYLVNRYGDQETAETRLRTLSGIEELLGLTANPRMLSFIADLPEDRLRAVARARTTVSPADLYREILSSWLAHEADRVRPAGGPAGLTADDMWQAVGTLALRLWEGDEQFLRPAELADVADALTGLSDGRLSTHQVTHAVGAGSLLVRTEEGLFGFIHGSVVEWLVARHIAAEFGRGAAAPAALARRALSQLTVDFLCDLADTRALQQWTAEMLADTGAGDTARANAMRVTTRLRTPARADLRGARLAGEDLSYRDLQEVDLTGADLTDAQLVGANLSRAVLRDASLAGARLDEARLNGADLRGADLSRARLARADLRDAAVEGGHWTRAALIDATLPDRIASAPELREAAIAPGRPVDIQVAPASIGVPYGFHFQTSRLPQPLAYSPGGSVLAVGGEDGGVLICDAVTGVPLRTLLGHQDRTYAVAFDSAGDLLVTGSADGTVRIWELASGRCSHTLTVHPEGVWPVVTGTAGGAGGTLVAAGAADGTIRVWDAATGTLRHELTGHTAPVYTAVFDPDVSLLVTGDAGGALRVWDLASGELRRTLTGHRGAVFRAVFHPDGGVLAAGDEAGVVRLWDIRTGEIRKELLGHTGRVYAIAFHPDGGLLVTGDTDGSVRLWDGDLPRGTLSGHDGAIYQATFSPDGGRLATADSAGSVRLWDPATGRQRLELAGHRGAVWPFAFRPDGAQLATTSNDGTARLWDAETGESRAVLRGHGRRVTGVAFSPDGGLLAGSGNDGLVRLWEPRSGRLVRELHGVADNLTSAAFNPRGAQLATATNDGGVHLWQAGTGTFERELNVETDHVWAQAFAPAGDVLATANDDDSVRLWYWTTGREIVNLADHHGRVRSIDFGPGGDRVATGCDDGLVRIWNARTGACEATLRGHTDRVYRVVFDPSGTLLASAGNDGTARLWDAATGETRHELTRHGGRLWTAAFDPSGTLLATAGDDLAVRLWDPRTGRHLHTLNGHTRRVWSSAFSPDGTLLATAGDDGAIILWDVADRDAPARRTTLLGLAGGWAAIAPDGRYKWEGDATSEFWYAVGMCRFEPGELDPYLPEVRQIPQEAEF